jgi:hypothetical protein
MKIQYRISNSVQDGVPLAEGWMFEDINLRHCSNKIFPPIESLETSEKIYKCHDDFTDNFWELMRHCGDW